MRDLAAGESEQELQTILRREHVKRDYHAKPGNIQEYMDSLKRARWRGKLKEVQAAAASTGNSLLKKRSRNDEGRA